MQGGLGFVSIRGGPVMEGGLSLSKGGRERRGGPCQEDTSRPTRRGPRLSKVRNGLAAEGDRDNFLLVALAALVYRIATAATVTVEC